MTNRVRFDVEPTTDTPAGGRLVALVGTPTNGQVPTYDAGLGYHTPQTPGGAGGVWMPLTTVVGGVPELVWDANDSLIPTLIP